MSGPIAGRPRLLAGLGLLYLTQGLPMGLAFEALPALMRQGGHTPATIGFVGLAILPWALRFLWSPWIDRRTSGRGRVWLAAMQFVTAGLYAAVAAAGHGAAAGFLALCLVCLASLVSATQNTVTDAYVVRALPRDLLGWVNGLQVGGFSLGMLLGGGLVLVTYGSAGWLAAWLLPAAVALAAIPLLPRQGEAQRDERERQRGIGLVAFLKRPGAAVMLSLAATFYFGRAFVGDMMSVVLVDAGMDIATIGSLRIASTGAMAAGALVLAGPLFARVEVRRAAPVAGLGWAATLLAWALLQAGTIAPSAAFVLSVLDGLLGGITYAGFLTVFMGWASRRQAGTDVTTLMCTESLSNIGATMLGGIFAGIVEFSVTYQISAMLMGGAMCWATFALHRQRRVEASHAEA
ncbi:MFS transporter [Novosphingobium resinovorum]|uniref:MFS transporter n=1 Tax=Novosphingobium resinovorum TaxID=158500 RepID=UPI002ECFCE48|nr:MFS transporter [Novosphingobium resinovorum]